MSQVSVVITGSTRGLGLAYASKFLELGDRVIISSRNREYVEKITQALQKKYPEKVFGKVADVTKFEDMKTLADYAVSKFGYIDIWINNAGVATPSLELLGECSPEKLRTIVDTNLLGTLYGSKAAISIMKKRGGKIYNMAGFGAKGNVQKGMTAYGATKRSIPYITKALSSEYKHTSIKFSTILPGMTITDLLTGEPGTKHDTRAYWVFNVISDTAENVAEKLVPLMKATNSGNQTLNYTSTLKIMWKFFTAWRYKNKYFDANGSLKIQKIEDRILHKE